MESLQCIGGEFDARATITKRGKTDSRTRKNTDTEAKRIRFVSKDGETRDGEKS